MTDEQIEELLKFIVKNSKPIDPFLTPFKEMAIDTRPLFEKIGELIGEEKYVEIGTKIKQELQIQE